MHITPTLVLGRLDLARSCPSHLLSCLASGPSHRIHLSRNRRYPTTRPTGCQEKTAPKANCIVGASQSDWDGKSHPGDRPVQGEGAKQDPISARGRNTHFLHCGPVVLRHALPPTGPARSSLPPGGPTPPPPGWAPWELWRPALVSADVGGPAPLRRTRPEARQHDHHHQAA
jgi:hypothetical protein